MSKQTIELVAPPGYDVSEIRCVLKINKDKQVPAPEPKIPISIKKRSKVSNLCNICGAETDRDVCAKCIMRQYHDLIGKNAECKLTES